MLLTKMQQTLVLLTEYIWAALLCSLSLLGPCEEAVYRPGKGCTSALAASSSWHKRLQCKHAALMRHVVGFDDALDTSGLFQYFALHL